MPRKNKGLSLRAAARELGLDESTLRQHDKAGLVIRHDDRSVDVESTRQSLKANLDPNRGGDRTKSGSKSPATLTGARTRKEQALADKAELEVAVLKGDLIPVIEAEAVYLDIAARVRAALEAVPVRMMHRLVGLDAPAIRKLLTDEINQALGGLDNAPHISKPTD